MDGIDGKPKYDGFFDCIQKIYHEGGIRSFFKGIFVSMLGIIPYRFIYFGGYDLFKTLFLTPTSSFLVKFLLIQTNVIISQILMYPIDTIRRYQMMGGYSEKYPDDLDMFQTFSFIIKNKGFIALFDGCLLNTIRAIGASLVMMGYDILKN
jgi:hypothetical protein